ncbi:hypothetical protein HMN09_01163500 [Mycena chlorophos]|uniref:Uncharacterized protein n=1 Tax=Mycena chlorophos TaxID=658473 RepID=A0A8H6S7M5_MYCCL|nr:hypothetical protein HMN09_01163500 [Mycena chlorophos]
MVAAIVSGQADPRLPISARPTTGNIRVGRSTTRKLYKERLLVTRTRLLAASTALKELWENDMATAETAAAASGQNEVDPLPYSSHSAAGTDPDRVSESTGGSGSRSADQASLSYSASSSDHTSNMDWDDSEIQKSRTTLEYEWELESLETIIEVGRLQERHLVASLEMLARQ